jgi:hypothetical protein
MAGHYAFEILQFAYKQLDLLGRPYNDYVPSLLQNGALGARILGRLRQDGLE